MKRRRASLGGRRVSAAAVLLLAGGASLAGAQETPRVIRVIGVGQVQTAPDRAHIDLAVEAVARTARAAGEQNAAAMDRVIRALRAAGVARDDIQTRGYSLFPEYARPDRPPTPRSDVIDDPQPRIVGYRAVNTVSVRTRDLARVGQLIDVALDAGANRMESLRFSLQDAEAAQDQALRQATEKARRSAEAIAASLGVRLGDVVEATTVSGIIGPVAQFERAMARDMIAAAAPTPIEPGEQTVTASVTVAFAIQGGAVASPRN
jgi:uncharacterized protein